MSRRARSAMKALADGLSDQGQPPALDPFALLCRQAAGQAIPKPPAIPGRVHTGATSPEAEAADARADAWDKADNDTGSGWLEHRSARPAY